MTGVYSLLLNLHSSEMTIVVITRDELGHAYQKMTIGKFRGIFWYGLNNLKKICVQDYVYMSSSYTGSWGGVKNSPQR